MPMSVNHRSKIILAADLVTVSQGARAFMRIMPAGAWSARDGRGPFNTGDLKAMQGIVERTLQYAGATELMVDYDHQGVFAKGVGGRAEAAGWVKRLEAREDGIWAEIEWTAAARAKIAAGEYRYLSPLFISSSPEGGDVEILLNVALVNMPAIDLEAVAAHLSFTTETKPLNKIATALGLAAGASEDAILAAATALANSLQAIALAVIGTDKPSRPEDVQKAVLALNATAGNVATALGLDAGAKPDAIVAMATSLKSGGEPDPTKYVPIAAMNALQTRLATVEGTLATDKATSAVEDAIKAGKIIPALRDWAMSLAIKDMAAFTAYVDKAVPLTASQMSQHGPTPPPAEITALSTEQKKTADMLGLNHDKYLAQLQAEQEAAR